MGKTLKLCDGAITTAQQHKQDEGRDVLAEELKHYVSEVFINRNVASEEMWKLSKNALTLKKNNNQKNDTNIIIGYFSGSITHNSDIEMIKTALIKILKEYNNVQLLILGVLDISEDLNIFNDQIINKKCFRLEVIIRNNIKC